MGRGRHDLIPEEEVREEVVREEVREEEEEVREGERGRKIKLKKKLKIIKNNLRA